MSLDRPKDWCEKSGIDRGGNLNDFFRADPQEDSEELRWLEESGSFDGDPSEYGDSGMRVMSTVSQCEARQGESGITDGMQVQALPVLLNTEAKGPTS
jgi:hypothetical protein